MLKKLTNKKGFTLMEMLIVVAIIAILVAIAIPTFNSALNKSKVAADTANIRSGYAAVQVQILLLALITLKKMGLWIPRTRLLMPIRLRVSLLRPLKLRAFLLMLGKPIKVLLIPLQMARLLRLKSSNFF